MKMHAKSNSLIVKFMSVIGWESEEISSRQAELIYDAIGLI